MLRTIPFANAIAVVAALFYVFCGVIAAVAPELYVAIARTWVHSMDITALFPNGMTADIGSSLLGLVTLTAVAWVTGAIFASLYNRLTAGQPA